MKRFRNILFVYEGSVTQDAAVARAVSLAQNNQARLTVVDVVPEISDSVGALLGGSVSRDLTTALANDRRQMLESLMAPFNKDVAIEVDVLVGRKFLQIIRAVLRNDYDLVIKPAENPDWVARLFGSNDMHLLRKCPCPVWLTHPEEPSKYQCIVAAVDADPDSVDVEEQALNRQILELASSLALADFATLHIVHAWDAPESGLVRLWAEDPDAAEMKYVQNERYRHQKGMDTLTGQLRQTIGADAYDYLAPKVHLPMSPAGKAIPALVRDVNADLVVMGTVARTGIPGLIIGNTAEAVLDQLECSVLATKPSGFVSPVADG